MPLVKTFLTIVIISYSIVLTGQSSSVDSIKEAISISTDEENKLFLYNQLIDSFSYTDLDSAIFFIELVEENFDKYKSSESYLDVMNNAGITYYEVGDYSQALSYLNQAHDLAIEGNYMDKLLAIKFRQVKNLDSDSKYEESIETAIKALKFEESYPDPTFKAGILNILGFTHRKLKRFESSLKYYKEALKIRTEQKDTFWMAAANQNLGSYFRDIKDYKQSIKYYEEAIRLSQIANHQHALVLAQQNISVPLLALNQSEKAEVSLLAALEGSTELSKPVLKIKIEEKLARVYSKQNRCDKAITILDRTLQHVIDLNELRLQQIIMKTLAECKFKQGLFEEATLLERERAEIQDSIFNQDMAEAIAESTTKYETEKKEAQIKQLQLEEIITTNKLTAQRIGLTLASIASALLIALLYRNQKQKKLISIQNDEKDILLREIHHRVKNNLQVVSSLLGIQSRSIKDDQAKLAIREGRARVHSMSLIHQNLYKKDNLTGVDMRLYLNKLSDDLFNTYNLAEGKIEIVKEIDALTLDVEYVVPIGLIINELISNALKYAFPNGRNGKIFVKLKQEEKILVLEVYDNGIGLSEEVLQKKNETFGHSLIRAFRKKLKAELDIKNDNGTKVTLRIKKFNTLG